MPRSLRLPCCAWLVLAIAATPALLASASGLAWAAPVVAGPEPKASNTGLAPERVLILGDSQAQGLSIGLQWLLRSNRAYHVIDRSKISSGLVNLNFYDWPAKAKVLAADEHPDVAIVMFGANDRPPVRREGKQDPRLLANFVKTYGARVQAMIATLQTAHVPVIWVGHPIVRDPVFSEDMATLNAIYADQVRQAGATFLPLWPVFATASGAYDADGIGPNGNRTRLRADDGIHMTAAGYEDVGKLLIPLIDAHRPGAAQAPAVPVAAPAPLAPASVTATPPARSVPAPTPLGLPPAPPPAGGAPAPRGRIT